MEKYIHGLFPAWGIRFVSIVDNADTANKGNKKSRQINGLVNEWYLEDMSDNIRSVLKNRRENGFHIGAFALYGYQKDPAKKGHLIVDEQAAAVVREIFTLFSQGYGKTAIARMLNDQGVPNPTEYKRLQGLRSTKTKDQCYLQCPNHHVAKEACLDAFISVDKLEQAVIDELKRLTEKYLDKDVLEQSIECWRSWSRIGGADISGRQSA